MIYWKYTTENNLAQLRHLRVLGPPPELLRGPWFLPYFCCRGIWLPEVASLFSLFSFLFLPRFAAAAPRGPAAPPAPRCRAPPPLPPRGCASRCSLPPLRLQSSCELSLASTLLLAAPPLLLAASPCGFRLRLRLRLPLPQSASCPLALGSRAASMVWWCGGVGRVPAHASSGGPSFNLCARPAG